MDWSRWQVGAERAARVQVTHFVTIDDVTTLAALQLQGMDLDEVSWNRKTVDRLVRQELHGYGWERYWFAGDRVDEARITAIRERVVGVYQEAVQHVRPSVNS
jgi:hypothetical protein